MNKSLENDKELIEKLLKMVKREVKQIMEEAVTKKFIHEDSGSITSLCATVDACLSHGLKRRALGLFKTNSTTALLQKVAKNNCEAAAIVLKKVNEIENSDPNKRSSSSSDSLNRTRMSFKMKSNSNSCSQNQNQNNPNLCNQNGTINNSNNNNNSNTINNQQQNNNNCSNNNTNNGNNSSTFVQQQSSSSPTITTTTTTVKQYRYLWIRIALFEKYLVQIVDHVVQNNSKYYERDALCSDPVAGQILASLLVGPCALDYTKMKPQDQFWTDPPADELVQRHKISSSIGQTNPNQPNCLTQSTPPLNRKRLGMNYKKSLVLNSVQQDNSMDNLDGQQQSQQFSSGSPITRQSNICWSPRDYVESLHQNSKSTLLYGKNNVVMQPSDDQEPMPGYLSLHQHSNGLIIKWTPNQLINGRVGQSSENPADSSSLFNHNNSLDKTNAFWNYALNVNVENIVYLHCHQQKQSCGSIVMVGRDGVMHPPILFPKGGHLLAFLSCLEAGLTPYGQLDPPLWTEKGKGKILPRLRRKGQQQKQSRSNSNELDNNEDLATDYVFRIISICDKPDTITPEMFDPSKQQSQQQQPKDNGNNNNKTVETKSIDSVKGLDNESLCRSMSSSTTTNNNSIDNEIPVKSDKPNIQLLCDTMKKQIISRAFYGWLAYCRHFKTVRTHLAILVNPKIYPIDKPTDASKGITKELWEKISNSNDNDDGRIQIDPMEFYRLIYYGGIEHSIRSQVWLYLLEHYQLNDTKQEKKKYDQQIRQKYEMIMSEWLAVEAIVRQRDKEIVAANLAKLSSESTNNDSQEMSIDKAPPQSASALTKSINEEVFQEDSINKNETAAVTSDVDNDVKKESNETSNEPETTSTSLPSTTTTSDNNGNNHRKPLMRHKQIESVTSVGSINLSSISSNISNSNDIDGPNATTGTGTGGGGTTTTQNIFITNPSVDRPTMLNTSIDAQDSLAQSTTAMIPEMLPNNVSGGTGGNGSSQCVSPASSNGGLYTNELLDQFSLNLHRIDKDVQRCDRNFWYFTKENLEKLRNVMCTYVWDHLEIGYVQGMCDLVAPLLVIFDDEVYTYSCFCKLMLRMASNFPNGGAMDRHFANMRSLIQILDSDIFELMHQNGDYTHFYFCYRWFLLDFKRELVYSDVFSVWETIWAAKHVSSKSFVLFIALALVEYYRDIILENNMDFTDIIKFFNEMAERHDAKAILKIARDLVQQIQTLMENK